jgi:alpha-galactosidase/6-phospho-beta-glucosidase family protein
MIGAGSVEFCLRLVKDFLRYEPMEDARIGLMDIYSEPLAEGYSWGMKETRLC